MLTFLKRPNDIGPRLLAAVLALGTAAGCAPQDEVLRPVVETVPIPTTAPVSATSSETTPDTTVETTTVTTLSPVAATFIPGAGGEVAQGLPPFLVAVREDSAVIEVDTTTGRTTRVLIPPPEPDPPDAEIEGNRIGQVWWHRDTGQMVVEEGPEPAGGNIWHQPIGADYSIVRDEAFDGTEGFRWAGGWQAAMSPNGRYTLHTGYTTVVLRTGVQDDQWIDVSQPDFEGSPFDYSFTPAWLRDRIGLAYTSQRYIDDRNEPSYSVHTVEMSERAEIVEARAFEISGPAAGLAVRADGALVLLLGDGDPQQWGGSRALVIDPDSGETIAEFALEPGSHSMDYDPSGTYLLYVDGEGTARWRGRGQSGIIADGLTHADW